ncbi:MAG: T9SS type A sorting domain-containing protein [Saprospirales bacterium]|nr:T9SS type A sorting domain-containing protein [Saprospirales bacterium]
MKIGRIQRQTKMNEPVYGPIHEMAWTALFLLLLLLVGSYSAKAQCTLVCNNPFPSSPLNGAVDQNCEAVLTADMILEGPGGCPGVKILEVRTLAGNLIVSGPEPVTISSAYLGNILAVTVVDASTWNECTGYIQFTDNLEPSTISCPNIEVSCNASTDPDDLGYPTFMDNCDNDVDLTYTQSQTTPDCSTSSPYLSVITRNWIATDNYGNQNTECTQVISLLKASIEDVQYPADVTQDCDNPNTSPDITGRPMINGEPIMNGNICMFSAAYADVVVYTCLPATHSYTIIRTWTVVDDCSTPNNIETYQQHINVVDDTGPVLSCQPAITVGTNSNTCSANVVLPNATASDNCSPSSEIDITIGVSFGGTGNTYYNVPVGVYTVTYTGVDECGNVSTCISLLNVVDNSPPVAVCDEYTVVSLTSSGTAVVPAQNLDDGSYDNCGPVTFKGSRNGGNTFTQTVTFDCADVGIPVNVIVRVYSANNPSLYNDCAVVVDVMDKLYPVVLCPANQVIDCIETYPINLSVYGQPIAGDNCSFVMTRDSSISINNCGEGAITRSFTVKDPSGNTATCTQTLTVQNLTPFNGTSIQWPENYTLNNGCITADQLDPEDLPAAPVNYSEPILPDIGCALLATNYSDQVFLVAYPACYKIVRTWTVMDWCTYNPANPGQGGIWSHTQIIKANDNIAPVFSLLPPDTVYADVDQNCAFGAVNLPTVTASDCSPFITVTNNSPFANNGGANASGMYPLGSTTVKYSAKDGCGNTSLHTIVVIVKDNMHPGLLCEDLVTDLGNSQGGISVSVNGVDLLENTWDNCTAQEDLEVFMRLRDSQASGPPATTSLTFTCEDLGPNEVEVWVVDESGNANFCTVYIYIQDNFDLCPPLAAYTIAGVVETESGDEVDDIVVHISGSPDTLTMGSPFIFSDQPAFYDYTLAPEKDDTPANGVTTYDLVLISRHILGVQMLNTPYKLIAADANRSGMVTTIDMVNIRKVILGLEDSFPGNTSWRFIDKDYSFPNPYNPFSPAFPEVININNLNTDQLYTDFVAIKVGDVNNSAAPNHMTDGMDNREFSDVLLLTFDDIYMEQGREYEVAIHGANFQDILGAQFTLNLDPQKIEWLGAGSCDLPNLGMDNFGERFAGEGQILFSWDAAMGATMKEEDCLFTIRLKALQSSNLKDGASINSGRLRAEAYRGDGSVLSIWLQPASTDAEGIKLYQNRPNPFNRATTIGFSMDRPTQGALVVFDLSGKEVYRNAGNWNPGYYEVTIGRELLPGSGMYFYKLEMDAISEIRKMILID